MNGAFLFFGTWSIGQSIAIVSPLPGDALDRDQLVVVTVDELQSPRVELSVDGQLRAARSKPPYSFRIQWDPQAEHRLLAIARSGDRTLRTEAYFPALAVDVVQEVTARLVFPFPDRESVIVMPQAGVRALDIAKYPAEIILLVDISGSMAPFKNEMTAIISRLLTYARHQSVNLQWVVFDETPRVVDWSQVQSPEQVASVFASRGKSVVRDSMAASLLLLGPSPRRVMVLVSDGADDGSALSATELGSYLKSTGCALIWLKTDPLDNRQLSQLSRRSGGFVLEGIQAWQQLQSHLEGQLAFALEPEVDEVISSQGKLFQPRWSE